MSDPATFDEIRALHTTRQVAKDVEGYENPSVAADLVMRWDAISACAVIDCMSPLGAAFVLHIIRMRGDEKSKEVIRLAEELQIKGVKGLSNARDEMFRQTGTLLV